MVLTVGLGRPVLAQRGTASLHGVVIVPSGGPVPRATVIVEGASEAPSVSTNDRGEFKLEGLAPGSYKVKVTAPGFDTFEVEISLKPDAVTEADAVLRALPPVAQPAESPAVPAPEAGTSPGPAAAQPSQTPPPEQPPQTTVAVPQGFSVTVQKGKAALYGVVTDSSGAVIQDATATAVGNGGSATAKSNVRGQYVLNGLQPGAYKLTVSVAGFANFEADITLTTDQSLEIDAALLPASARTEVSVEASNAAQVQTESAHIEGTITQKEVEKIGLNGRNFTQLIALAPGVSNQTGQDEAKVGIKGSVKYSVNGGRVEYNNFDVDGSDVLNAGLNGGESTLMVYPSLDAIQEVKVLTSNYGAQYGRTASGTVLVSTKTGTAQFHGVLYDFLRNEFFNARNYFDETTKAPLYRRQDFGGTIGGPLYIPGVFNTKKDKTFFFWSEEVRLEKSPQGPGGEEGGDFNQAVPTLQERSGNFSDVCPAVTPGGQASFLRQSFPDCPSSGSTGSTQLTFPGNQVPIDPNSALLFQSGLIPAPNSTFGCNSSLVGTFDPVTGAARAPCYDAVVSPPTYWREELFRLDHNFTPGLRASARYIHDSWDTTEVTPLWGYVQNSFPTVQNRLSGPGTSMVVRLTDTISPSLLNEFVVSYANSHITLEDRPGPGANLQRPAGLDMSSIFNNGFGGKVPGLVIAGTNAQYGGSGFTVDTSYPPWEHSNPTYALADNVSKVVKGHTVQFGVQVTEAQRNETNGAIGAATGDQQGILTFSNQNNGLSTGNAFADFLIQQPGSLVNPIVSFQQDSAQLRYHNNYWVVEPYLQDDWRVNHRLTVNLGLRISLFGNYHEKNLNAWNWDPSAFSRTLASTVQIASGQFQAGYLEKVKGGPITIDPNNPSSNLDPVVTNGLVQCGKNGIPDSCMSSHTFNPAPRVGFAWDPKGDGKTSIRGGYGVFFEHGTAKEANTGSLEGSSPLVLTMTNFFPLHYNTIGQDTSGDQVAYPLDVTSIPSKTIWPYVQQWSLSVQRQLPRNSVATIAYVGSKGTHLSAELQANQLTPLTEAQNSGIFLNGNPFGERQPLTTLTCNSFGHDAPNAYTIGGIGSGGLVVTPAQPAWTNLTAACYGVNAGIPNPNSLRTYAPGFQRVLSLQNIADSEYHALQTTLRRASGPLTVGVSYTYSHSLDDSSDRSNAAFSVNTIDIKSSHASSDFDERHLLNFSYVYDLPKLSGHLDRWLIDRSGEAEPAEGTPLPAASDSRVLRTVLDGWQISGITLFASGTPFSVINGGSNVGISLPDNGGVANGVGVGSYPDVIGNAHSVSPQIGATNSVGPLLLNPAAFAAPRGLTFGDAGRNYLNNPHRLNFDFTLLKNFKIQESGKLEFRFEVFNVFNHTQFRIFNPALGNTGHNTVTCYGGPNNSAAGGYTDLGGGTIVNIDCLGGSSFLHPLDAHRPRTIQLGLKYSF